MTQYPATIELSALNGTTGFKLSGVLASDQAGFSVSSAGDINGDGFADILIGAKTADVGGVYNTGAAYVVFGQASGFAANLDLSTLNGTNGFRLSGQNNGDQAGISVASGGDVNGDGFADFIVGARWGAANREGATYVVFGHGSAFPASFDLGTINGTNGFRVSGAHANDYAGSAVSSAGDINGDGFTDLVIGAGYSSGNAGTAYVVFGKAGGFAADLNLSSLNGVNGFTIPGAGFFGWSVGAAGDVNGDGFADFVVGASYAATANGYRSGASYVVFGKASGFASTFNPTSLTGANGFKISGEAAYDHAGWSVSSAGDVNGDGYGDIIVGAQKNDAGGHVDAGAAYVVFGKASGFAANIDPSSLNGTNGFKISGTTASDLTGISVSSAGDVNGDGFTDLIVGAEFADPNGASSGAAYVVFGKASGFGASIDLSTLDGTNGFKLNGVAGNDYAGFSVSSAGDVNGDGVADMIVGARNASPHGGSSGASYVVFGRLPDAAVNLTGTNASQNLVGGDFGDTILGGPGNDHLWGHAGADSLGGDAGNDILDGGAGDDTLDGAAGVDTATYVDATSGVTVSLAVVGAQATGGAGSDTLTNVENLSGSVFNDALTGDGNANVLDGGLGDDALNGGGGSDTASYIDATSAVTVSLAIAIAQNTGGAGSDTLTSIENLIGSNLNDTLTGDGNANVLEGGAGDDSLNGGGGNDTASYAGAGAAVTVSLAIAGAQNTGGAGTDTLTSIEGLLGSRFADTLTAAASGSSLSGGAGNDLLYGGPGNDAFDGGSGVDTVAFTNASAGVTVSLLLATPQNTVGAGTDTFTSIEKIVGSAFVDTLTASNTGSTLNGGPGGDDLYSGPGSDILNGGGASDFAEYALATAGVTVNLNITTFQNTVGAGSDELVSIEKVVGSNFNDTITGDAGVNTLFGQGGNDTVNGGDAGDYLYGGTGNDILTGGAGQDYITSGTGSDTFVYTALSDSAPAHSDIIQDFTSGQDRIDVSAIDADAVTAGDQAFHFGSTVGHTGDLVVSAFDVGHNRTYVDLYVNNDATIDAEIILTGDHHGMTAADFVL